MFRLFVVCALVPLLITAFFADRHAQRYFESRASRELRLSNHLFTKSLSDALLLLESALRVVMVEIEGDGSYSETVLDGCRRTSDSALFVGIGLKDKAGMHWAGESVDIGDLGEGESRFLESGRVLLALLENEEEERRLVMFGKSGVGVVYGVCTFSLLEERILAKGLSPNTDIAVMTTTGQLVMGSLPQAHPHSEYPQVGHSCGL